MTNLISLTLESVSYQLPDGSILFADLHEQFDRRHTGLVGRNGIGKSVLARILSGELVPSAGRCIRVSSIYYLPQQISIEAGQTVADLAGVKPIIDALQRIERGSTSPADFECIGERWDIRPQLQLELNNHRLSHLHIDTPATALSGGEAMRVALLGAFLAQSDFLILDEPTNHLDGTSRRALREQLQQWKNGLIAISHDRVLLEDMQRIVELTPSGLHSYGGGYSFYLQTKTAAQQHASAQLAQRKAEHKREERLLREQRERLQRRQARGKKQASQANQAAILLGGQRQRSETSAGKLNIKQQQQRDAMSMRLREAAQQVEDDAAVVLYMPTTEAMTPHRIAELDGVVLSFISGATQNIDLAVGKGQRIGLVGANGSGKSTLLRLLAGLCVPLSGQCGVFVNTAYLDQQLSLLNPDLSTLQHILDVNNALGEAGIRTRLAQLGLDAQRIVLPTRLLSGGERLKSALAYALYADNPAQLLLLDEPSNHLDLPSLQALENMLRQYRGTLMVVSHDEVFLQNLALTDRLSATCNGWLLEPWPAAGG